MKSVYVTSLDTFSGKTAFCLGLGRRLQADGYNVGFFKPFSTQPWQTGCGLADEDVDFVRRMLNLPEDACDLVGVVLTEDLFMQELTEGVPEDTLDHVKQVFKDVSKGKDIMILEGGASLREGFCLGLGTPIVSRALSADVLVITTFEDRMAFLDACRIARLRMGKRMLGVVANRVPDDELEFVRTDARAYLEQKGINLLGALPLRENLQAISVGELATALDGEFLTLPDKHDVLIEHFVIGAMRVEQAMPRIRRIAGSKAIITGGDRADMQLVALEMPIQCLILTGYLRPVPEVLSRAEEFGVPVLLVRENTLETVEAIERVFGKTRLGQSAKMEQFEQLMEEHFDFERLYTIMDLER